MFPMPDLEYSLVDLIPLLHQKSLTSEQNKSSLCLDSGTEITHAKYFFTWLMMT